MAVRPVQAPVVAGKWLRLGICLDGDLVICGFGYLLANMDPISAYYDALAPDYDRSRFGNAYGQFIHRQERQALTNLLRDTPPKQVLDLACGTGRLLEFAETGCDLSPKMIAEARQKYPSKTLVLGEATGMPFENGTFSTIISMHFLMHLDRATTSAVLAEAYRVLQPGGRFIFDFPSEKRRRLTRGHHHQHWHGSNALSRQRVLELGGHRWEIMDSQGILFFPIHRVYAPFRPHLLTLDTILCRSFLQEYASYVLVCMQKT